MKLKLFIIPALMVPALFAQGREGYTRGAGSGATHTPPTPAQLAANELTMIARLLKLDSADTSKLTGNATLVGYIETEQSSLQTNAAALKAAYSALATDIATNNTKDAGSQETTIETTNNSSFQARVTAASQIVAALPGAGLSVTLTSAQLTSVAQSLVRGGGGQFVRFGRF